MGVLAGGEFLMGEVPLYRSVEQHACGARWFDWGGVWLLLSSLPLICWGRCLWQVERETSLLTTYWSESTASS